MPYKPGDITKGTASKAGEATSKAGEAASKAGEATIDVARKARRKVFDEASRRGVSWWQLPLPGQLAALALFREDLREFNLYDTEEPQNGGAAVVAEPPPYRSYDGSQTDPKSPTMGRSGTRFGRNVPPEATYPEEQSMLDPSPRVVANRLLNRDTFKPATTLNVLAACWLQFQNHDWFSHGDNSETEFIEVPIGPGDEWDDGVMEVRRTSPDSTNHGGKLPPTYINKVTPWWDGSQLYGSTEERNRQLRSGEGGKLAVENGRLPEETKKELDGVDLTGFSDNYWAGLSVMHTLFANEHNAICDMLKAHHPTWDDEQLFLKARLINGVQDLHPDGVASAEVRPVLHQRLHARGVQAGGNRVGRGEPVRRRGPAPPPGARARARGIGERVRAVEGVALNGRLVALAFRPTP